MSKSCKFRVVRRFCPNFITNTFKRMYGATLDFQKYGSPTPVTRLKVAQNMADKISLKENRLLL